VPVSTLNPPVEQPPYVDLYTRNGFAGPSAMIVRAQYTPPYSRVKGTYAPYRFDVDDLPSARTDDGHLAVPILEGDGVSVELATRTTSSAAAVRNVLADELHYLIEGQARLDTDFGHLLLRPGDFVLIPRAVTYRYAEVGSILREVVVVTESQLAVEPEHAPGVLNVDRDVDVPIADPANDRGPGEYEVVIRHGQETTSYFYDYDPLPAVATAGAPIVRRFNFADVHSLGVDQGGLMPPRIINDPTTRTLFFNLSNRRSDRPPVHHNADYDEVIFYVAGPGRYGAIDKPGTITWTPKGIIHQGPAEDVPDGYKAWLLETRSALRLTDAGREIGRLMETGQFDLQPDPLPGTSHG